MKWELHTYYNEPVNCVRLEYGDPRRQMKGREHTLKDPVGLCVSCSACHKSYNGMENEWESFRFCPNCADKVEGIDETSKLWCDVMKKYR